MSEYTWKIQAEPDHERQNFPKESVPFVTGHGFLNRIFEDVEICGRISDGINPIIQFVTTADLLLECFFNKLPNIDFLFSFDPLCLNKVTLRTILGKVKFGTVLS